VTHLEQRREAHGDAERGCCETERGGDVQRDLRRDDGTTAVVVSVAKVAALAILAVERWPEVERVHGTRVADGDIETRWTLPSFDPSLRSRG
jgi:hypothetical protein